MVLNRRIFTFGSPLLALSIAPAAAGPSSFIGRYVDAAGLGLIPDAPEDQSEKLVRALELTAARGEVLGLRAGSYRFSDVNLPDGTRLAGFGARITPGTGGRAINTADAAKISLDGLTFFGGAGSDRPLVSFRNVPELSMTNCEIEAGASNGLALFSCSGDISGNHIHHCRAAAIFAQDCLDLDITDNRVNDCQDNGILVWQSVKRRDGARITGNRISHIGAISGGSGQYGNGINIFRAGEVLVSGNHIHNCAYTAVRVNGGDNCQIIGNICNTLGEVALYMEFDFQGGVIANNIVDTAGLGISVTNFGNAGGRLAVVSGNLIRNLFTPAYQEARGVGISVEADAVVTGNTVENAALFGMVIGWGTAMRDVTVSGNVVRESPVGIAVSVTGGAGKAAITGNRISGAKKGAILGMDLHRPATGDLTDYGATIPKRLTLSGNSAD